MSAQEYRVPAGVSRVQRGGWFVGGVALLLGIVGAIYSPDKFYQSYLFSYLLVLGLTLGSLGLLMLQQQHREDVRSDDRAASYDHSAVIRGRCA